MFFKDRKEYEKYLQKNEVEEYTYGQENYFNWTGDGYIKLENDKFLKSNKDVSKYTNCMGWRLLSDGKTMVLIKRPFGDIYRDLSLQNYYKAIYNNIILPQVAKQFQISSATYYLAKKDSKKKTKGYEPTYIVTKDFKHKDEELIHGETILEENEADINELNINQLIDNIMIYLERNGYTNANREQIRREFIKQSFFNRFVKQVDENNHNWALLVDEFDKTARMAPVYDLDCCCEIGKRGNHIRKTDDGSTVSLDAFICQYKDEEWFKKYIEEVTERFDIEKSFLDAKQETNFDMSEEYKNKYRDYFALRKRELQEAYDKVYSKNQESREIAEQR